MAWHNTTYCSTKLIRYNLYGTNSNADLVCFHDIISKGKVGFHIVCGLFMTRLTYTYVWDAFSIFDHLPIMFMSTDFAFKITD